MPEFLEQLDAVWLIFKEDPILYLEAFQILTLMVVGAYLPTIIAKIRGKAALGYFAANTIVCTVCPLATIGLIAKAFDSQPDLIVSQVKKFIKDRKEDPKDYMNDIQNAQ